MSSSDWTHNNQPRKKNSFSIKRTPTIENQIEVMLDKIMDDEEIIIETQKNTLNLKFKDTEEDEQDSMVNSENRAKYERLNKKFPTYSFNAFNQDTIRYQISPNFNQYSLFMNGNQTNSNNVQMPLNQQPCFNQAVNTNCANNNSNNFVPWNYNIPLQVNKQQSQPHSSPPQNQSQQQQMHVPQNEYNINFKRNDNRKKTHDPMSVQNSLIYNNQYNGMQNWFLNQYNYQNPSTPHQSIQNNQTLIHPSSSYSMQMEMLLYDLNLKLVKANQIDFQIYSGIKTNFISILKTHKGSRIFQNYLKNTTKEIIHEIFLGLLPNINTIISDSYANYFCKRFYTHLQIQDRLEFLKTIQPMLVKYSIDSIGTYPIQGIIEDSTTTLEQGIIINSIKSSIQQFCFDTYGAHVIEKIISCFNEELISFIFDFIMSNFISLASNINGICIIKKLLSTKTHSWYYEQIKTIAFENAWIFVQHPYANYVIQMIAEYWEEGDKRKILDWFKSKYVVLSMKKYSSNAVESCIKANKEILNEYIEEICWSGRIAEVMKNNYGNYVIQKAWKISEGKHKQLWVKNVEANIFKLLDKKLISKWKSILEPHWSGE